MSSKSTASMPDAGERMECRQLESPHESVVPEGALLSRCELRTQRRSGPGGQHRNKTSSGAFLTHRPTGVVAEATERRSQAQNRDMALQRMRYLLAIESRTTSPLDVRGFVDDPMERVIRQKYRGHNLRLNEANPDKPAVIALVLNDLWVAGGQPSLLASEWSVSTSKLVAFVRSFGPAMVWVNRVRVHHQRLPLH